MTLSTSSRMRPRFCKLVLKEAQQNNIEFFCLFAIFQLFFLLGDGWLVLIFYSSPSFVCNIMVATTAVFLDHDVAEDGERVFEGDAGKRDKIQYWII